VGESPWRFKSSHPHKTLSVIGPSRQNLIATILQPLTSDSPRRTFYRMDDRVLVRGEWWDRDKWEEHQL
jgi:hypothetical protein